MLLLARRGLGGNHGDRGLAGRQVLEQCLDELVSRLALRDPRELPEHLGDLVAREEHAARVPGPGDAPEDVGMLLLALEGDAVAAQLLQALVDRGCRDADVAGQIGLLPRSLIEERLEDRDDGLGIAALSHGRILVPTARARPARPQ